MSMDVLQNKTQITDSRKVLDEKGVSSMESPLRSVLRRLGLVSGVMLGDQLKSWDVLETLKFIEQHVAKSDPILDIGCYASEIIVALHKSGYSNLTGADMNPALNEMPFQNSIRYEITDFLHTAFADASFSAITSISVIEHGFDGAALLKEISRLLRPGGYFIASFDYWPEKIDTTDINFFDMTWMIFSKQDVEEFVSLAAGYGLSPMGSLNYESKEAPIECGGKNYTFGWLVLRKSAQT